MDCFIVSPVESCDRIIRASSWPKHVARAACSTRSTRIGGISSSSPLHAVTACTCTVGCNQIRPIARLISIINLRDAYTIIGKDELGGGGKGGIVVKEGSNCTSVFDSEQHPGIGCVNLVRIDTEGYVGVGEIGVCQLYAWIGARR